MSQGDDEEEEEEEEEAFVSGANPPFQLHRSARDSTAASAAVCLPTRARAFGVEEEVVVVVGIILVIK